MRAGVLDVLVLTGGKAPSPEPALAALTDDPGVEWMQARHPNSAVFFDPRVANLWDAFLFLDHPGVCLVPGGATQHLVPPRELVDGFDAITDEGTGLVFIHRALGGWPIWPDYGKAMGGRFLLNTGEVGGVSLPASGYRPDTWHRVGVVNSAHPVTEGLGSGFELVDELLLIGVDESAVTPLLVSDFDFVDANFASAAHAAEGRPGRRDGWSHPAGSRLVAWTNRYRNSDVVSIAAGGSPLAWEDKSFRRLVGNALRWVSRTRPGGPAIGA